jgi:hypothetical protein
MLLADTCVLKVKKSVEEDLACYFKAHPVLDDIAGRLLRIPHESLAMKKEVYVHPSNVYMLYIRTSSDPKKKPNPWPTLRMDVQTRPRPAPTGDRRPHERLLLRNRS